MPSPEQKRELEQRYLKELLKVGFSEAQAKDIVAEAADRLGTGQVGLDRGEFETLMTRTRPRPQPRVHPAVTARERAVNVVVQKQHDYGRRRHVTWGRVKDARKITDLAPGRNAMEAMQELLARDMKVLEFTDDDIKYVLEGEW
jgi:Zn-finger nucleic acid-binding protein